MSTIKLTTGEPLMLDGDLLTVTTLLEDRVAAAD